VGETLGTRVLGEYLVNEKEQRGGILREVTRKELGQLMNENVYKGKKRSSVGDFKTCTIKVELRKLSKKLINQR
jgi:hypothetical protein